MSEDDNLIIACERDMTTPDRHDLPQGRVVVFTRGWQDPSPEVVDLRVNQDAFLIASAGDERLMLAVADGLGGHAGGEKASRAALETLAGHVQEAITTGADLRDAILNGFEAANTAVKELRMDAGTTLAVVDIDGDTLRTYHAGDSAILVVGQRGLVKLQTVAHSPVGYAVEAGILDEKEAMHHEDRHIVSNIIGTDTMRIEIGPILKLGAKDTVLLATDGLYDNLHTKEIVDTVRKGPLLKAAETLRTRIETRMIGEQAPTRPSKPDDLTYVLYRRT
ncbi:MAG TPA: protein phosphatase 2C domain-containing protein [Phycisphaerae bacterium]|nr:protein phosphatase 2C domain-containing protein [Phycisphaerae bacterium]HRW53768.1 protein phosphatase 2C domain-containing protein [Phycisphaerae bacterium]